MKDLDSLITELDAGTRIQAQMERAAEQVLLAAGAAATLALIAYFAYRGNTDAAAYAQNFYDNVWGSRSNSPYVSGDAVFGPTAEADIAAMSPTAIDEIAKNFAESVSFTDPSLATTDVFAGDYEISMDDHSFTGDEIIPLSDVYNPNALLFGVQPSQIDDRLEHFSKNAYKANKNRAPKNGPPEDKWKEILTAGTSAVATQIDKLAKIIAPAYRSVSRGIVPAAKAWCDALGMEIRAINEAITNLIEFGTPTSATAGQYQAALMKTMGGISKMVRFIAKRPEAYRASNLRRVLDGTSIALPEETMQLISNLSEWGMNSGQELAKISEFLQQVSKTLPQ